MVAEESIGKRAAGKTAGAAAGASVPLANYVVSKQVSLSQQLLCPRPVACKIQYKMLTRGKWKCALQGKQHSL